MANRRLNTKLDFDFGAGGTFYNLINKSPMERYVLDFASPYLISGIGYYRLIFTYGGGKVSRKVSATKMNKNELPPIIYNPRF